MCALSAFHRPSLSACQQGYKRRISSRLTSLCITPTLRSWAYSLECTPSRSSNEKGSSLPTAAFERSREQSPTTKRPNLLKGQMRPKGQFVYLFYFCQTSYPLSRPINASDVFIAPRNHPDELTRHDVRYTHFLLPHRDSIDTIIPPAAPRLWT